MPVNFNAMIQPQIGTAMMEGSAARENSMLKNQQMANSQQEMAMRQQKFGQDEAERQYILSERARVADFRGKLQKHFEENGANFDEPTLKLMASSPDKNIQTLAFNGIQALQDERKLDDMYQQLQKNLRGETPQPAQQAVRPSMIPPPANFSPVPTNAMATPAAPTNALAAPRRVTREDLVPFAMSSDPRANRFAALLTPSKTAGPEILQLLDELERINNPKSQRAIEIQNRINLLNSVEARQQPQRPELGTAEGSPGGPKLAYQITPGKNGLRVDTAPISGTEQPTQAETLDVKQRAKLDAAYPKASSAFRFSDNKLDTLIEDVIRLKTNPGLGGMTGLVYGRTPGITDAARSAEAEIEALKARGSFNELREMRIQSPTGGALGNVSDREGVKLEAAFAALKQTQSTEDYKKKLDLLLSQLKVSKGLIKQAFDEEYGYKQSKAPDSVAPAKDPYAGLPRVTNNDDFLNLKSGAEFIAPDNTRRRKP